MDQRKYLDLIEAFMDDPFVERGRMFGMPCLKVHNKAFAVEFKNGIVFKLPSDARQSALEVLGAQLWAPFSKTHVKREWVYLADIPEEDLKGLSTTAMNYVSQLAHRKK